MESADQTLPRTLDQDFSFATGLSLAVASSLFIGTSFTLQKIALGRLDRKGHLRAGSGGFGYLNDWIWWLGFLTMGVGEVANFAAYTFASASLVTPLGALSVLVSTVLASKFLDETLGILGKLGCLLCVLGSVVIIIHSPKDPEVRSVSQLLSTLHCDTFYFYLTTVVTLTVAIVFYIGPKYGHRHVVIYLTLCSTVGSLTVIMCKGLGLTIKEIMTGLSNEFSYWLVFAFLVTVVLCIVLQMNYLNRTLDLFNMNVVTPVYYVMFTTAVILTSRVVFRQWSVIRNDDLWGSLCGFVIVVIAIFLLMSQSNCSQKLNKSTCDLV